MGLLLKRIGHVADSLSYVLMAFFSVSIALLFVAFGIGLPAIMFVHPPDNPSILWIGGLLGLAAVCLGVSHLVLLGRAIHKWLNSYHWSALALSNDGFTIAGHQFQFTDLQTIKVFHLVTNKRINFVAAGADETVVVELCFNSQDRPIRLFAGPLVRFAFGTSGQSSCRKLLTQIVELQRRSEAVVLCDVDLAKMIV